MVVMNFVTIRHKLDDFSLFREDLVFPQPTTANWLKEELLKITSQVLSMTRLAREFVFSVNSYNHFISEKA